MSYILSHMYVENIKKNIMSHFENSNGDDEDDRNICLRNEHPMGIRSVGIPCAHLTENVD